MKRIDIVFKKLKEMSRLGGIDAKTLAEALNLSRANVSSELNRLCEMGKVKKSTGRPVLFTTAVADDGNTEDETSTTLDKLIASNKSLVTAGEQARAAILYPPRGMNAIILGETGVGKTMFAGIMHKFAMEMNKMAGNSPFITFNCADYSNNPQLLLSQLFGVKKGAFTGADADKSGLIEKADGGILFLDEVHRLPAEGQEMFFTFMDKGIFMRLGETGVERRANVLIIAATTENPDSTLLKTFTRRIPMIIRIPGLSERTMEERFGLITNFFREESTRLDREIIVSVNSMRAFLSYICSNNIGQLKSDIQLTCARAYADFLSHKKDKVIINSSDLPSFVREGLYKEVEHRKVWNSLIGINNRYLTFSKDDNDAIIETGNKENNIYEFIDYKVNELKNKGVSSDELDKIMEKDINDYFTQYFTGVNRRFNKNNLLNVVEPIVINVVDEILRYSEEKLEKVFSQKVYLAMAIHIEASINRMKINKKIINPQLQKIRTEHVKEFNVAIECLSIIERELDISLPIDEAGFLTMFFVLEDEEKKYDDEGVGVLVVAHGNSTATSMADVANNLLCTQCVFGINAPLDESPQTVLDKIRDYMKVAKRKSGFLFLVDMGSLTTFGEIIERENNIPVKVIPMVSTLHVLEAARKTMLGYNLEEVFEDVSGIASFNEDKHLARDKENEMRVILTVCMTGEGSAITIKNFLQSHIKIDSDNFEIMSINLVGKEDIRLRIKKINREKKVICVVGSFKLDINIPQFTLEEVLNLNAIKKIQYIIDVENTYIKLEDTLKNQLKNVEGSALSEDVKKFIASVEDELNITLNIDKLIALTLHISCMVDRLLGKGYIVKYPGKEENIAINNGLYETIRNELKFLYEKYKIDISEDEICYIMDFFNPERF